MNSFRRHLIDSLDELDNLHANDWHEGTAERAATIAAEAGSQAARLGLPAMFNLSRQFGAMADVPPVKAFVAECLAALPAEPKPAAALLSVEGVASTMDVSTSHVYRLADGGRMPRPVKVGGLVRWVRSDLEAWIAAGCKPVRTAKRAT
jgi:excisionase family DNA binding protein